MKDELLLRRLTKLSLFFV